MKISIFIININPVTSYKALVGSWSAKGAVQAKVRGRLNDPSAERIHLALSQRISLEKMKVCAPE